MAQAVGIAGNREALVVLEQLLKDQQPQPRLTAARALGRYTGGRVIALLKDALKDSDAAVRIVAAGSLMQVLAKQKR